MSLAPESRVLLTDALRPPAGHKVEVAVGTTYTLDLTALLLAPMSFAAFDLANGSDTLRTDPVRLLEAAQRHTEHTTLFCQAGGIYVPSNYRSILMFVEDSVREVTAPDPTAIFHPKIWALRFADQEGAHLHRLVCLSRNLTMDTSWDTALVLEESDDGVVDAGPAADFVRRIPDRCLRPLTGRKDSARLDGIGDLADSLGRVRLAPPEPFTDGELIPMGLSGDRTSPFPAQARRVLAISPFLDKLSVTDLTRTAEERTILSRAESLERVGSNVLDGWDVNVLQRAAEVDSIEEADGAAPSEFATPTDGLHAKTYVLDLGGRRSTVITGSANLTRAGWSANVEFATALSGPTSACGVSATLDGSDESPGLRRVMDEYAIDNALGVEDSAIETAYALEQFHQALAAGRPVLQVRREDEDRVTAVLQLTVPDNPPGETKVWPASVGEGQTRRLHEPLSWSVAAINVTPFIAVETTAGEGEAQFTRRCVLVADLTGELANRRQQALSSVLRSKEDVLRYLVFLLGDPSYDVLFADLAGTDEAFDRDSFAARTTSDVALFEPLVRATGRDADAFARVAGLVDELENLPNGDQLAPDGFEELWDVVWQVHREALR